VGSALDTLTNSVLSTADDVMSSVVIADVRLHAAVPITPSIHIPHPSLRPCQAEWGEG